MDLSNEQIAEAFSRHRFAETYPYLAGDVRWTLVGGQDIVGSKDVMGTCDENAGYLGSVTTRFTKFRVVTGADTVVVDSTTEYVDGDETSVVASCDLYDFAGGKLTGITSYSVDLPV